MKPAQGYVSDDGQFFATEQECSYYEARSTLVSLLEAQNINSTRFIIELVNYATEVRRFLDAYDKTPTEIHIRYTEEAGLRESERAQTDQYRNQPQPSSEPEYSESESHSTVDRSPSNFTDRTLPPGVQQLTPRRPSVLPDMGDSEQSEEVSDRGAEFGT